MQQCRLLCYPHNDKVSRPSLRGSAATAAIYSVFYNHRIEKTMYLTHALVRSTLAIILLFINARVITFIGVYAYYFVITL